MMISTKGRYALRVMIELALKPEKECVSLKAISEKQGISVKYLEAIVATLSKARLVESFRGKSGGYKLSKKAEEYTVGEILRAAEGNLAPVSCLEGENTCERAADCLTLPLWQRLDEVVESYLDSVTLEDLVMQKLH